MMVVEELPLLLAGGVREQLQPERQRKRLGNALRIPVIAVRSEALYAMKTDSLKASRFDPFALPRWGERAGQREFAARYGRPLPRHLHSPFGDKDRSQGLIAAHGKRPTGRITAPLGQAVELVVRHKTESNGLDFGLVSRVRSAVSSPREPGHRPQEIQEDHWCDADTGVAALRSGCGLALEA